MFKNRLPTRDKNHSSESFSYKIFSQNIPNNWIIRDITERDYGVDVLVEYVTDKNEVTGKFAAIQLKSVQEILFKTKKEFRYYAIKPSTTDYWLNTNIPTFVFFISHNEDIYFLSVSNYVKGNYLRYCENEKFYYSITQNDTFTTKKFIEQLNFLNQEKTYEAAIMSIGYLYKDFLKFFKNNYKRDEHMQIESSDIRINQINSLYYRFKILSQAMSITWQISSLEEIAILYNYNNNLYEFHLSLFLEKIDEQILIIIKKLKEQITPYYNFWVRKDPYLVDFLHNHKLKLIKELWWKNADYLNQE